jgi:hypothetical protein
MSYEAAHAGEIPVRSRRYGLAADVGRRLLSFPELQMAMALGALVCLLVGRLVRAPSSYATDYHPGTFLFFLGDIFFLTLPVVAWMLLRGRGWRHSLELAGAMVAPVVAIVVLGELTGSAYLLCLVTAIYPAMSVGMVAYMVYRRDVFEGRQHNVSKLGPLGRGVVTNVGSEDD